MALIVKSVVHESKGKMSNTYFIGAGSQVQITGQSFTKHVRAVHSHNHRIPSIDINHIVNIYK